MDIEDFNFLEREISSQSENIVNRYYDIIESLEFSVDIGNINKIDFEFNNLLDLMDDIDSEECSKVFAIWKDVIDNLRKIEYET